MADFLQRYNNLKERVSGSNLEKLSDKEILELYEEAKEAYSEYDNMQLTVKLDGNSLYGVSASQYFSLHDYDIAEDITGSARHFAILIDVEISIGLTLPNQNKRISKSFASFIRRQMICGLLANIEKIQ